MTEEQIIEIIKLEAHKNLIIVDEGTDSYNDYVIRGVDLMAKSLVKLFDIPTVISSVCEHKWEHYLPEHEIQICKKCISLRFTE
jgi:hypothetical protein